MEMLLKKLRQLQIEAPASGRGGRPDVQSHIHGSALEIRTSKDDYFWHGLKRGGDPAHPLVVVQYTLEGRGEFVEKQIKHKVEPGMAFTAIVPSDHSYCLPADSTHWSFFWLIIRHPYVVNRIEQRMKTVGPLLRVSPESPFITRGYRLLAGMHQTPFQDSFSEEQSLFDFLIEYERTAFHLLYSASEREQLLQSVRTYVLRSLHLPLSVEEIAAGYHMSRSHFSHYFKNVTGITPAHFITQIRLDEAIQFLLHTGQGLGEIAEKTGFADANHLCKVFRRQLHLSPSELRRQMYSPVPGTPERED